MKLFLLGLLFFAIPAFAEFAVPATPNPVNDYAGVLTVEGKEKIAHDIVQLKEVTGAQAGVVIVKTLDGVSIEEASMRIATTWKLGSQAKDDGILVLLAVDDHKMRIEVGQGLEGIVTDYESKHITSDMKPYLRKGDYDGAVSFAVTRITNTIVTHKDEITTKSTGGSSGSGVLYFLLTLLGLGAVVVYFVRRAIKADEERERKLRAQEEKDARSFEELLRSRPSWEPSNIFPVVAAVAATEVVKTEKKKRDDDEEEERRARRRREDDDSSSSSSFSSSSSYDSGSSSSGTDWGGSGGGFSGGGSSDSW